MRLACSLWLGAPLVFALACGGSGGAEASGGSGGADASGGSGAAGGASGGSGGSGAAGGTSGSAGWPAPNDWSWDGSWSPATSDFPLAGLFDNEYFDGHADAQGNPTPILPPGAWDWDDAANDLANWRNFEQNIGTFQPLTDSGGRQYGWTLAPKTPGAVDYSGPAMYFEGSSGADVLDLGAKGTLHSLSDASLADGPDVLVFNASYSLDFRTGSSSAGHARDNDLVVAGCDANPDGSFDITTTTIHTGPGSDWVFARDLDRSAIDLGNGANGRTDTLDPNDGDDLVVLRGNTHDFRVFGGAGDDVAVWYVDDNVQTAQWLGPNFFGGGGLGDALWDNGTDRLVLAVPASTPIVSQTPTPDGSLLVKAASGAYVDDPPTKNDPYAYYCVECGTGPAGQKTLILEYNSADGSVHTGYFYVTGFEELQLGVGPGAKVFRLDNVAGSATAAPDLPPFAPPSAPAERCN